LVVIGICPVRRRQLVEEGAYIDAYLILGLEAGEVSVEGFVLETAGALAKVILCRGTRSRRRDTMLEDSALG
jgi:hypothetical protein